MFAALKHDGQWVGYAPGNRQLWETRDQAERYVSSRNKSLAEWIDECRESGTEVEPWPFVAEVVEVVMEWEEPGR